MELSKGFTLFILFLFFFSTAFAQPSNDDCQSPILITDVTQWCSGNAAYTNVDATDSGYGAATCFNGTSNDVWFSFVATATDVTVTINGNQTVGGGGTLNDPEVTLYFGTCGGTLNQLGCAPDPDEVGNDIVEMYRGGLLVGATYLIRVQGRNDTEGTFELCINNYNPTAQPGSDCPTSAVLCDKSSFVVQQVTSAGNDPNEAIGTCLDIFGNTESNSTWFTWICEDSGPLTFTLTPLNAPDDLDFVVYELPNGIDNCSGKQERLCMAAGDTAFPSPCMGPTGLSASSSDTSEPAGCNDPSQDNFVAPLNMVAGTAYALIVNNFSESGNGFSIDFGGAGTFLGPQAAFNTSPSSSVCYGETMTFTDASSSPLGSAIVDWDWSFGVGASPGTASGSGPHVVDFDATGSKSIVLTVRSDLGCIVTEILNINVDPCCNTENVMFIDDVITDLECAEIEEGAIDIGVNSNVPPYIYEWSNGETTQDINNLGLGDYMVTITNDATCDTVLTYTIDGPPPILANPIIQMPTCNGGTDGAIVLDVSGGTPGYEYSWEGGPFQSSNILTGLPVGLYNVVIRDINGCELELNIQVDELELLLDANMPTVNPPTCDDTLDGSIVISVANGTGPFEYNWNDGGGWVNTTTMLGLNNGTYTIDFRDFNGCVGDTTVIMTPPTIVTVAVDTIDISCFGANDGIGVAIPGGGVGGYTYLWSDGQTDSIAVDLGPGNYTVTVLDSNGCDAVNMIGVVEPDEVFLDLLSIEDVVCFGDSTGIINVIGSGGTAPYTYSIDGLSFQQDTSFMDISSGTYVMIVEDMQGCQDSLTVFVNQPPELIVDAGPDQTTELGYPINLQAVHTPPFLPVDYMWSDTVEIDCPECPRTSALPPNSTIYQVTITDENGCTAVDEMMVNVVKNRPVYIPNVFSPNNDGINDFFTAYAGPAAREILLLRVFNRWGALVYETENIPLNADRFGWNGRFKDQQVTPDVFAYYIVIDFIDDVQEEFEGSISVAR